MGKKWRKKFKKIGRKAQKITAKASKIITPVVALAATVAFGPVAGAAVAGVGAGIGRVTGATAARDKGLRGRDARAEGRKLAKKNLKWGLMATGVGAVANVGISLATGGNVLGSLAGGQTKIFGGKDSTGVDASSDSVSDIVTSIPGVYDPNGMAVKPGSVPGIPDTGETDEVTRPGQAGGTGMLGDIFKVIGGKLPGIPGDGPRDPQKNTVDTDGDGVPDAPAEEGMGGKKLLLAGAAAVALVLASRSG